MAYNSTHTGATIDSAVTKVAAASGALIDGSGTANKVSKFSAANTITDSLISDDGTTVSVGANDLAIDTDTLFVDASADRVGVNDSTPSYPLDVNGDTGINGDIYASAGTSSRTAVTVNNPDSALCPKLTMTRQGGSTSTNDFISLNTSAGEVVAIDASGGADFAGALSKGSGSFKIQHPLESKRATHNLVHSFLEGPQADLIYRGRIELVDGVALVNIDMASDMTDGTFVLLCRDVQSFTTNESGWTAVRSSVDGNILTIEAQDDTCTDSISWMVVGERQDQHMHDTEWTDENGKVIVEPELK